MPGLRRGGLFRHRGLLCPVCGGIGVRGVPPGGAEGGGVAEPGDAGVSSGLVELGPYVLEEELGRGGMGRSIAPGIGNWAGEEPEVLRLGPLSMSDDQARFRREAQPRRRPSGIPTSSRFTRWARRTGMPTWRWNWSRAPAWPESTRSGPLLPERGHATPARSRTPAIR